MAAVVAIVIALRVTGAPDDRRLVVATAGFFAFLRRWGVVLRAARHPLPERVVETTGLVAPAVEELGRPAYGVGVAQAVEAVASQGPVRRSCPGAESHSRWRTSGRSLPRVRT